MKKNSINDFLSYAKEQQEVSLAVINGNNDHILSMIKDSDFLLTFDWLQALQQLENNKPTCLVVEEIDKGVYDLISQYSLGMLQYFDQEKFKQISVHLPKELPALLVVATDEVLEKTKFSVLPKVGLIYRE